MVKTPSTEEITLFRDAVGEVKPIVHDSVFPERPRPEPIAEQARLETLRVMQALLSDDYDSSDLETGEELLFLARGVRREVVRRLRRGDFSMQAQLDLHGMTVPLAKEALSKFLRSATMAGHRCVIIIHGKGHGSFQKQPVLKGKLNLWLQRRKDILAFSSARPADGGTGAVYVLLRR
ncbi:MAG: Smr/MutS family protein [Pseudomonadota bacterium]|nr:Smr/MutS family protein [Pseudomonadota bacterium]